MKKQQDDLKQKLVEAGRKKFKQARSSPASPTTENSAVLLVKKVEKKTVIHTTKSLDQIDSSNCYSDLVLSNFKISDFEANLKHQLMLKDSEISILRSIIVGENEELKRVLDFNNVGSPLLIMNRSNSILESSSHSDLVGDDLAARELECTIKSLNSKLQTAQFTIKRLTENNSRQAVEIIKYKLKEKLYMKSKSVDIDDQQMENDHSIKLIFDSKYQQTDFKYEIDDSKSILENQINKLKIESESTKIAFKAEKILLVSEIEKLHANISTLVFASVSKNNEIETLQNELVSFKTICEADKTKLEILQIEINSLNIQIETLKDQLTKTENSKTIQIESLQHEIASLKQLNHSTLIEINTLQQIYTNESLAKNESGLQEMVDALLVLNDDLKKKIDLLKVENEQMKSLQSKTEIDFINQIDLLKSEIKRNLDFIDEFALILKVPLSNPLDIIKAMELKESELLNSLKMVEKLSFQIKETRRVSFEATDISSLSNTDISSTQKKQNSDIETQLKNLTSRFLVIQQENHILQQRLDDQLKANSEIKRMLIDATIAKAYGGDDSALQKYYDSLIEISELRSDLQVWQIRYEEMEQVVEKVIMQRSSENAGGTVESVDSISPSGKNYPESILRNNFEGGAETRLIPETFEQQLRLESNDKVEFLSYTIDCAHCHGSEVFIL